MTVRLPRAMVMCDGARRCVMGRADCVRKRPCPPRGHDDFVVVCPGVKGLVSPELRVANDVLCQNRGGVHTTRRRVGILHRSRVGVFPGGIGGLPDPVHRQVVAVGEFSAQLLTMLGSSACSAIGWD